ncbi:MAG TPA: hypothetical protein GXX75_06235 [Clostridiales bacterium]|nr:hypothetical protein [Clostridiales bacterium]
MVNPAKLFKLTIAWNQFVQNHPKFPLFMKAVENTGIEAGTIIDITITTPEGKNLSTNIKVTSSDKELLKELSDLLLKSNKKEG